MSAEDKPYKPSTDDIEALVVWAAMQDPDARTSDEGRRIFRAWLESVRAEACAEEIKKWHHSGRQQHTERELAKVRAQCDALAASLAEVLKRGTFDADILDLVSAAPSDILAERDARMKAEGGKQALLDAASGFASAAAGGVEPALNGLAAKLLRRRAERLTSPSSQQAVAASLPLASHPRTDDAHETEGE